jgi:hypothetical protein
MRFLAEEGLTGAYQALVSEAGCGMKEVRRARMDLESLAWSSLAPEGPC